MDSASKSVVRALLGGMLVGSCALETQPGDGLTSDGLEITVSPAEKPDAGDSGAVAPPPPPPDTGSGNDHACKHLALFTQHAVPQFKQHCTECHEKGKPKYEDKAGIALPLDSFEARPDEACLIALYLGAEGPNKLEAALLTSPDPSRVDKEHDFKFDTPEQYAAYRDAILLWLSAEKP